MCPIVLRPVSSILEKIDKRNQTGRQSDSRDPRLAEIRLRLPIWETSFPPMADVESISQSFAENLMARNLKIERVSIIFDRWKWRPLLAAPAMSREFFDFEGEVPSCVF